MQDKSKNSAVLLKSSARAGENLGMTKSQIGALIGINPEALNDVETHPTGELDDRAALLLIELFKRLSGMVGHDPHAIQHWMETKNRRFDDTPIRMARTLNGLERLLAYLESVQN